MYFLSLTFFMNKCLKSRILSYAIIIFVLECLNGRASKICEHHLYSLLFLILSLTYYMLNNEGNCVQVMDEYISEMHFLK